MVHPSLYEGFGFPIIEALACGAQVVCSGNSSMRELGEGRLRLFDPRSRSEIANAIQEGIESQLAENTRKELMAYASSFEWKSSAEQVLRVYNKL
jgi:glycosyltransferase involved in cell wall biosynthesis